MTKTSRLVARLIIYLFWYGLALAFDAPAWAAMFGAGIIAYLAVPEPVE